MKKLLKLAMATLLALSSITLVNAQVYQDRYYTNEVDYYSYLGNVMHASSYDLPEKYDSRDYTHVTSVKNQGSYETYWIHAMLAASETNILKKGLATSNDSLNLSELAAGYVVYHAKSTDTELTTNDSSSSELNDFLYGGGHLEGAAFMLARGGGITSETTVPYTMAESDDLQYYLNGNTMYWSDYRLKDAIFIPHTDEDAMKEAIIKYGAVALKYQSCRINDPKHTYVYRTGGSINSALEIIGYDDTVSKEWFYGDKPSRDGAWIVKNSWGNTANGGIFYLSYDHMVQDAVAYVYAPNDYYDHNYHYDATPSVSMTSSQANVPLKAANFYQAQKGSSSKPEYLRSVAVAIGSVNTDYEIQIYTNITDETNPESGTAMLETPLTGSKNHPGYYTIDLPNPILLEKGTKFSVVVTLRNRNPRHLTFIYTSESCKFGDYVNFNEGTNEHQSFLYEGDAWNDLHQQQKTARIRALTTTKTRYESQTALDTTLFELENTNHVYTGHAIEPEVKCANTQLQEGRDYRVYYENNILSGQATVIVEGINAYTGMVRLPFTIEKRALSLSMIEDIENQMYNGSQIQPNEKVLFENRILQRGVDYDVTFGENISGKGTITIAGKNQFTGTIIKEFNIRGMDEMCYFQAVVEPADAGGVSIQSSGFVGESINAVTSPYSSRYIFVYWKEDGEIVSRDNPYRFTAEKSSVLTAEYRSTKEYADLQDLYIQLKDTPNDGYNETTWNQFQADLSLAQELVSNYLINDDRLGACYYWLSDSYQNLSKEDEKEEIQIDYSSAQDYLNELLQFNISEEDYTPNTWVKFNELKEVLENMVNQQNAPSQEALKQAITDLKNAQQQLVKRVDMQLLRQLQNEWSDFSEANYTKNSWEDFTEAKGKLEQMLLNDDATQDEVDQLYAELQLLKMVRKGDVEALEKQLNEYKGLDTEKFTPETYKVLDDVMKSVEKVMVDKDNLSVEDVEKYKTQLLKAYQQLKMVVTSVNRFNVEVLNYKQVKLTWDVVEEADVYIVQKQNNGGVWVDVREVTTNEYINYQKTGVKYTYRVIAKRISDGYYSKPSEIKEAMTHLSGIPVLQHQQISSTRFRLSWTSVDGATRYIVYRKEEGGSYRKVLTLGGEQTFYETNSLNPNKYYYVVKAARYDSIERVMTKKSNEVLVESKFDKPVLSIKKYTNTSALLQWNEIKGVNYYEVYRKTSSSSYKKLKTQKTCSFIAISLKKKEVYYFKVRGYKKVNDTKLYSPYSSVKTYRNN